MEAITINSSARSQRHVYTTLFPDQENIGNGTGIGTLIPIYRQSINRDLLYSCIRLTHLPNVYLTLKPPCSSTALRENGSPVPILIPIHNL
jgi:hypothetical protein